MKPTTDHFLLLLVSSLFLTICAVELFSEGMFMDGLYYATISRNMAAGLGSFWQPHLTQTLFDVFYEHPPLAFGLQSVFFWLFGDHTLVERIYSLLTFAVTGYLMALIWKQLSGSFRNAWLPLLLYFVTGGVAWAAANNMLENTMGIFVCFSVFAYFKQQAQPSVWWVILAGISLSMGLLTKGFFCLYVWGLPFFVWLFLRKISFGRCVYHTLLLVLSTVLPIALLYALVPQAKNHMLTYVSNQVLGSIKNVQTVDSRFTIVLEFLSSIAIPVLVAVLFYVLTHFKKQKKVVHPAAVPVFLLFTAMALSGVLPIMISMKQRSFYILTVYPLFALGLAYWLLPVVEALRNGLQQPPKWRKFLRLASVALLLLGVGLSASQINRIGRDHEMLRACHEVIDTVGTNARIHICTEMFTIWSLHGYMARYGNVSLDTDLKAEHSYFLTLNDCEAAYLSQGFERVHLKSTSYKLYRRIGS